jgi:hypothetical protein
MLQRAASLNQLADAQDLIADVGNKELRDQLQSIYRQRMAEMSKTPAPAATEAKAAPAKRVRRSASAPE